MQNNTLTDKWTRLGKSNIIFKQGYLLGDASHSFADYVYRLFG